MNKIWKLEAKLYQEWNNFNASYLLFMTDEHVFLEGKTKESDYNVDLANEMLKQIGIKTL